jgi:hypothetical protein
MRFIFAIFMLLSACSVLAAEQTDMAFRNEVATFIDGWHDDAAHARIAYFNKMAPEGVYIGTDKHEMWQRDAFHVWAKRYFDRGSAWSFKAIKRNIYFSADKHLVWWDEQLITEMGICQASGVLRASPEGMAILHYQLSLSVPNEVLNKVQTVIGDWESIHP